MSGTGTSSDMDSHWAFLERFRGNSPSNPHQPLQHGETKRPAHPPRHGPSGGQLDLHHRRPSPRLRMAQWFVDSESLVRAHGYTAS